MDKTLLNGLAAVTLAIALAACSLAQPPPPQPPPPPPPAMASPPPPPPPSPEEMSLAQNFAGGAPRGGGENSGLVPAPISITRYVGVDASGWPDAKNPMDLSDYYTSVGAQSVVDVQGAPATDSGPARTRDYDKEKRSWLARLFSSRTSTLTTEVRLDVTSPNLTAIVPLFSVSHVSSPGVGETWVTNLTSAYVESPMFRIGPNTKLTILPMADLSDKAKSQVAVQILGAVQQALAIASPQSALLTTLSKSEISSHAQALDVAISGLMSEEIKEGIPVGRFMSTWTRGASIMVTGTSPGWLTRTGDDTEAATDMRVGQWAISFRCPRPSAFDSADICGDRSHSPVATKADRKALEDEIVAAVPDDIALGFMLSSQVTVQQFIQTQSAFTTFVQKTTKQPEDDDAFCMAIVSDLSSSGLNGLDTALVVRAMIDRMPGLGDAATRGAIVTACQPLVKDHLTLAAPPATAGEAPPAAKPSRRAGSDATAPRRRAAASTK